MSTPPVKPGAGDPRTRDDDRPLDDRFWPYADLPEEPTPEELAALDPELHAALFGEPPGPFSISLVFPRFDAPDYEEAVKLARKARDYREIGSGEAFRHRATFHTSDARAIHELFSIVGRYDDCEVLIDGRPLPHARELWLPLVWFLIRR
ncbi:MAG TPA: hypothetical protein VIL25_08065 [Vicinamibacterales bacterium]